MPSQEDYLDELLNQMSEEDEGDAAGHAIEFPSVDAVAGMSEEEIDGLLAAGSGNAGVRKTDSATEDVMDILGDAGNGDLQDIHDMLQKSDRNEAIESVPVDTDKGDEPNPADRLLADIEEGGRGAAGSDGKEIAADEKDRKKESTADKKAAKAAAKAEKAAVRAAAKAEKRKLKKKKKQPETEELSGQDNEENVIREFDMSRELDILDNIVSGAGRRSSGATEQSSKDAFPKEGSADRERGRNSGPSDENEEEAFENTLDVVALDMEEADAYIPDISESTKAEEEGEKKKSLFSRLANFLTEEEEEPENEDIRLSEENEGILNDLDSEEGAKASKGKQGKKAKKDKKAKPKKKKEAKPKKAKPAKPARPKKEKKPKEAEPVIPGSRLTFKKMLPILFLGVTVGAVIFLFVNLAADYSVKQEAIAAYNAGDYRTCYKNLYGRKLNETEAMMFGKSESVLYIQMQRQEYEMNAQEGEDVKALDRLIQIVDGYPALYQYAAQWNAGSDVQAVYEGILGILSDRYGVTEAQAQEIAAIKSDIEYTRAVTALAEGRAYGSWNVSNAAPQMPENVSNAAAQSPEQGADPAGQQENAVDASSEGQSEDELPEESDLGNGNFVDNQ